MLDTTTSEDEEERTRELEEEKLRIKIKISRKCKQNSGDKISEENEASTSHQ